MKKVDEQRKHFVGRDETGKAIFANTAEIPMRSLSCVGGLREGRNYTRRKNRRGIRVDKVVTAMMLVAVTKEIARRRAKNKAAAKSRRENRR